MLFLPDICEYGNVYWFTQRDSFMCPPQCLATIKLLTDIEAEYVLIPLGYDFKVAVLVDDSSWQTDELHAAKLLSVKRTVANVNNWPIPDDQQLKDC